MAEDYVYKLNDIGIIINIPGKMSYQLADDYTTIVFTDNTDTYGIIITAYEREKDLEVIAIDMSRKGAEDLHHLKINGIPAIMCEWHTAVFCYLLIDSRTIVQISAGMMSGDRLTDDDEFKKQALVSIYSVQSI